MCIRRVSENINNTSKWSAIIFMSSFNPLENLEQRGIVDGNRMLRSIHVARNKLWPTLKGQACAFECPFRIARSKDLLHVFQSRRPRTGTREPLINSYWSAGSRRVAGAVAMSSIFLLRAWTHARSAHVHTHARTFAVLCTAWRKKIEKGERERVRERERKKEREPMRAHAIALDFTGRGISSVASVAILPLIGPGHVRVRGNCHCILAFDGSCPERNIGFWNSVAAVILRGWQPPTGYRSFGGNRVGWRLRSLTDMRFLSVRFIGETSVCMVSVWKNVRCRLTFVSYPWISLDGFWWVFVYVTSFHII